MQCLIILRISYMFSIHVSVHMLILQHQGFKTLRGSVSTSLISIQTHNVGTSLSMNDNAVHLVKPESWIRGLLRQDTSNSFIPLMPVLITRICFSSNKSLLLQQGISDQTGRAQCGERYRSTEGVQCGV